MRAGLKSKLWDSHNIVSLPVTHMQLCTNTHSAPIFFCKFGVGMCIVLEPIDILKRVCSKCSRWEKTLTTIPVLVACFPKAIQLLQLRTNCTNIRMYDRPRLVLSSMQKTKTKINSGMHKACFDNAISLYDILLKYIANIENWLWQA